MPTPDALNLVVHAKDTVAEGTVLLTVGRHDHRDLPAWAAGAHIDLHLGVEGIIRQYSLCSSPADRSHYQVAVLREPAGRGGSAYIHDRLATGDRISVSAPRNNFELVEAKRYLFIAGGIGITPILPMIDAVDRAGAEWELHYGGRSRDSMAFRERLAARGSRVSIRPQDQHGLLDLARLLAEATPDTAVYCCGPEPLLSAVEAACSAWPAVTLHVERFAPVSRSPDGPNTEFDVEFAQSGVTLTVPRDKTIIQVAEDAGVPVVYSCEEGTCGVCETPVLEGEPDHRDSVLNEHDRRAGKSMLICVSRCRSNCLVLDA